MSVNDAVAEALQLVGTPTGVTARFDEGTAEQGSDIRTAVLSDGGFIILERTQDGGWVATEVLSCA
jgi:hypothetical protein